MFQTDHPPFQPLVRLSNVPLTPCHFAAMEYVQEVGFEHPTMHGGGVGDLVTGAPTNDFDITTGCRTMHHGFAKARQQAREASNDRYRIAPTDPISDAKAMLQESFGRHPDTEGFTFGGWARVDGAYALECTARSRKVGYPLHIVALYNPRSIEEVCAFSDAPITCIGMDAGGRVFAHPDFEAHAAAKIYAPFHTDDVSQVIEWREKRFPHLARKIPGLRLVEQHELKAALRQQPQRAGALSLQPAFSTLDF
jgi:hypothetical protein